MSGKPENPQAFPLHPSMRSSLEQEQCEGMTLRDYFAGKVMPSCFAEDYGNDWGKRGVDHAPRAASRAYAWADAMLAARGQQ